jgi:hypothetical protein
MPRGGYMVVHDYNHPESDWGAYRAVNEFLAGKCELLITIPDMWGTVLFRKV